MLKQIVTRRLSTKGEWPGHFLARKAAHTNASSFRELVGGIPLNTAAAWETKSYHKMYLFICDCLREKGLFVANSTISNNWHRGQTLSW